MKLIPEVPTDETLRQMLAVEHPASFKKHLRYPLSGPDNKEWEEKRIAVAQKIYAAVTNNPAPELQWQDYLAISESPDVDECIRNLLEDHTEDNAVCMVRVIVEALQKYEPQ